MKYNAFIEYRGAKRHFTVDDCGYGEDWAKVRAISYFFHEHPEVDNTTKRGTSYRERAQEALYHGLQIALKAKTDT